jgi:hypothetical protein
MSVAIGNVLFNNLLQVTKFAVQNIIRGTKLIQLLYGVPFIERGHVVKITKLLCRAHVGLIVAELREISADTRADGTSQNQLP